MMSNRRNDNSRNGYGNGGKCVCTSCNTVVEHGRGTPCTAINCPKCGSKMIREELVNNNNSFVPNRK